MDICHIVLPFTVTNCSIILVQISRYIKLFISHHTITPLSHLDDMMAVSGSSPRVCNKIYNCCCKCNFGKIVQILDISTFFVHILQEWLVSSYHTTVLLLTRARLCQTVQTVWATRTSSSFVTFLFPPQNHPSSISRDWQWVVGYKMRIIIILHIFFRLVRPRHLPPPPPHTQTGWLWLWSEIIS